MNKNYLKLLLPEIKMIILKYVLQNERSICKYINNNAKNSNTENIRYFRIKTICDIITPEKITYTTFLNKAYYYNNIKLQNTEFKMLLKRGIVADIVEHFKVPVCIIRNMVDWYNDNLLFTFKYNNISIVAYINRLEYYRYFNIILIIYYKLLTNDIKRSYRGYKYNMKNTNADKGIFEIIFK
jgi:hypothetical protein